jgi:hypothetical protein
MEKAGASSSSTSALDGAKKGGEMSEVKERSSRRTANAPDTNSSSRHMSPSSSSASLKKPLHSHLGLRPKASDSLHTRLRSSIPAPKHASMIEDITASGLTRPQRKKSRDDSFESRDSGHGISASNSCQWRS